MRLGKFDLCRVRNLNWLAESIFHGFPILFGVFTIVLRFTVTLCLSEFDVFLNFLYGFDQLFRIKPNLNI